MPATEPSSSRLFAAIVLMGCSIGGCVEPRELPGTPTQPNCHHSDPDAGPDTDAGCPDGGWPPTK